MSVFEQWGKVSVWAASPQDAVGGMQPRLVARPQTTQEVSTVLAGASAQGLAVVARGAGTTLAWGAPPSRVDLVVDTRGLAGIVEHVAGDLVVVARAGTRLRDLQASLAGSGQRLAVDGDHDDATLGGLVAQGVSGPSRVGYGTLRDLLIGVTFVRADGVVAHSGGKVVKNVAGYDLGKLLHGSCGTLAVLTELVFRLHPLAQARRWVTFSTLTAPEVGAVTQAVMHSQLIPAAVELDRPAGGPATLAVLLEGRDATVAARAASLAGEIGSVVDVGSVVDDTPPVWWGRRPGEERPGEERPGEERASEERAGGGAATAALLRLTTEVAGLPLLLDAVDDAAAATGLAAQLRGSAGAGSLLAAITAPSIAGPASTPPTSTLPTNTAPGEGDGDAATAVSPPARAAVVDLVSRLRRGAPGWGGTVVVLDGPAEVLQGLDRWGPVAGLDLMRRVKEQFDPEHLLSPGRFVGGI